MTTYPFAFTAAILERNNAPLVIDEVTFAGPLQEGQVLVRILFSGICGKQVEEITGTAGPDPYLPHMLGHEGGGIVVDAGPGVTTAAPGDHVVLHWMKGKGIESETPYYTRHGKRVNAGWVTTFNDFGVVSENRLTVIPADSDMRLACLLGCAVTTGVGAVFNEAALKAGDSVAVFGCGGVGLNVVQGAALSGAKPIIAVDRHENALERAKAFGATHAVLVDGSDVAGAVSEITGGGADCVFVTAASATTIETGAESAAIPGSVFIVGVPPAGSRVSLDAVAIHHRRTIAGSHGGSIVPDRDIPGYLGLYDERRLKLNELIVDEVPLRDINDGVERLVSGGVAGRIVVRMDHG